MDKRNFEELASLFFEMRQTIRANLPQQRPDPNAWMRCETLRFIAGHERPTSRGRSPLRRGEGPTMHEIAKHLRITAPSATSLVRKLDRLGWVERKPSGSDKRVVRISLTTKGQRELARYRAQAERTMRKVFSKLPERDLSHLKRALKNLRNLHSA